MLVLACVGVDVCCWVVCTDAAGLRFEIDCRWINGKGGDKSVKALRTPEFIDLLVADVSRGSNSLPTPRSISCTFVCVCVCAYVHMRMLQLFSVSGERNDGDVDPAVLVPLIAMVVSSSKTLEPTIERLNDMVAVRCAGLLLL